MPTTSVRAASRPESAAPGRASRKRCPTWWSGSSSQSADLMRLPATIRKSGMPPDSFHSGSSSTAEAGIAARIEQTPRAPGSWLPHRHGEASPVSTEGGSTARDRTGDARSVLAGAPDGRSAFRRTAARRDVTSRPIMSLRASTLSGRGKLTVRLREPHEVPLASEHRRRLARLHRPLA